MPLTFDNAGDVLANGLDLGQAGSVRNGASDADTPVRVVPAPLRRADQQFAFAGIDGLFHVNQGTRGRLIVWRGSIRAKDDAALNAIEADIDTYVVDGKPHAMADVRGRTWDNVVLREYRPSPEGRIDAGGPWTKIQDFEIVFEQLRT